MIKAVLFDMDGTVLDTEPISYKSWQKAFESENRAFDEGLYKQCMGLPGVSSELLVDEFFGEKGLFRRAAKTASEWFKYYSESEGVPVKAGFYKLSDYLIETGVRAMLVTSSAHESAVRNLSLAGIIDRFDGIIGGDSVVKGKPHPDPFLKAAELAGAKPGECLAVEDSKNGLVSASAAGIKCIYIKDMFDVPEAEELAFKRAGSLDEIINIIKEEY